MQRKRLFDCVTMDIKGRVVVFTIIGCPHCMKAKHTLQNIGIPYTDVRLDAFPQCRNYLKEKTGKSTVPQIFFNNILIGGNDDLNRVVSWVVVVIVVSRASVLTAGVIVR